MTESFFIRNENEENYDLLPHQHDCNRVIMVTDLSGPWKIVTLDFKGPVGGKDGFHFHIIMDTYSCYPDIALVPDTKFETLRPVLKGLYWTGKIYSI